MFLGRETTVDDDDDDVDQTSFDGNCNYCNEM